jgi:hypothetical protein
MLATRLSCLLAACAAAAVYSGAAAARTAVPDLRIPDRMRIVEGGRKVFVVLHSPRQGDDNPDSTKVMREQAPLRDVLSNDDFDTLMPARLEAVVNSVPWLGARDFEVSNNYRWNRIERALDESNTRQMLVIRTEHNMSADYRAMSVYMRAILLNRQIPKGKTSHARFTQDWTPYQLDLTARISLPGGKELDREESRRRWAANDGRLAGAAIESGIEWVTARFRQTLLESESQSLVWRKRGDRAGTLPNGRAGWILEQRPAGYVGFEARGRGLVYEGSLPP